MKFYNTLTRQKEEFVPLVSGTVSFYLCGPTVYNNIHIGNARTFLSFDVIRRYLEYSGYTVDYVQNITDVDDKIINRAQEEGKTPAEIAAKYTQAFVEVMRAVGVKDPTVRPKATEEIPAMIELIQCLIKDEHAYVVQGDVYFAVRSFVNYGCLSGRKIDDLMAGARVDVDERKNDPLDFALWKAAKEGEPSWPSPWGPGRPGWHIECSAMSERYLGTPFDIHAGGEDLIFPHHENELAQSEACYHNGFARYWLHGGMLTIDKEKMSKSEGNFLLLKDVLEYVRPQALRLLMLQTHYRSPFDYSPKRLDEATASLERIEGALKNVQWRLKSFNDEQAPQSDEQAPHTDEQASQSGEQTSHTDEQAFQEQASKSGEQANTNKTNSIDECQIVAGARARFKDYMDDDCNTAGAVAVVFDLVSEANRILALDTTMSASVSELRGLSAAIYELLGVLGVELALEESDESHIAPKQQAALFTLAQSLAGYEGAITREALDALLAARTQARQVKDWATADAVRDGFAALGLAIEDTPHGPRVTTS